MKVALLFHETDADLARRDADPKPYWGGWSAYIDAILEAGIMRGGESLEDSSTATTVRAPEGRRIVQDGPFADTKERLGGFVIVEVAHLDEALDWAAKAPCAERGSVEVRPTK